MDKLMIFDVDATVERRTTARVGRNIVVPLLAALVLTLAGCWSQVDQRRMDRIAADIQATLARRPDVVAAEVIYANNLTSSGAFVNLTVTAGAAFGPVVDEAVELVWQSRLEPLHSIDIGVIDAADRLRGQNRYLAPDGKDKAALEARYGRRPG